VAPCEQGITQNEADFVYINNTKKISKDNHKAKVFFRDDRKPRSSPRKRCRRPRRGHRRGPLNTARPTPVFGAGRRHADYRRNTHGINYRTSSRKNAKAQRNAWERELVDRPILHVFFFAALRLCVRFSYLVHAGRKVVDRGEMVGNPEVIPGRFLRWFNRCRGNVQQESARTTTIRLVGLSW